MNSFLGKIIEVSPQYSTLVELIRFRASHNTSRTAFTFLIDGESESVSLSYADLDRKARAIAAQLQQICVVGERALILYPPGLDYIATLFGCLYAGVVAVPAYPPRNTRNVPRIATITKDAEVALILTPEASLAKNQSVWSQMDHAKAIHWLATDTISPSLATDWQEITIHPDTLAVLQYTSGSTSLPKGVMLTHGNLLHNLSLISTSFQTHPQSQGVIWLPPYHDMGLIGGILQPLYAGFPVTLMSPVTFLQRPLRWLQAISQAKATVSGGPNFAYELCIRKTTPEQRLELDLSGWEIAFNGAEPIHAGTLDRFAEAFAPSGFRREAFYPCYGLAEATLIVTGGRKAEPPVVKAFQKARLTQNQAIASIGEDSQTLVSCGRTLPTQAVVIVDPETLTPCQPEQVGEIWVTGNSVAQGYWKQPEQTKATFQARLNDQDDVHFLRTGDLGFLQNSELFVTGRLKDLMIMRGRNYYPQDIEWTVDRSHVSLQSGCSAAFAVEAAGEERLVIVREIDRHDRDPVLLEEMIAAIRRAVAEQHDLEVYGIILVKLGSIPKTSSGKIQHFACREAFLTEQLPIIHQSIQIISVQGRSADSDGRFKQPLSVPSGLPPEKTSREIQTWLIARLAEKLGVSASAIDIHQPLAAYGLGSLAAVSLAGELEDWLECRLSPTVIYDYPTIAALAQALAIDHTAINSNAKQQSEANRDTIQSVTESTDDIAIIGIGCRFPGSDSPEAFWQLIQFGKDAIQSVPRDRWRSQVEPSAANKLSNVQGGFLDQIDGFDSQFFGIAPREADRIDPQHRLLMEVAWEALEAAGQSIAQLAGSETGVFMGISSQDYAQLQSHTAEASAYTATGNAHSMAANRLSYLLNFQGPSMAVDTACSSSLVAVHLACQSLRTGECDLALVGGVNLMLSPTLTIALSQAGMLSPDGRCKTFDASADGYGRGEGCGVVVLKPLKRAIEAGDTILAVIKGSAVNQDGLSNGLTAPNGLAQQRVMQKALQKAGVRPDEIGYVEAHGTGTALGDPIELSALKAVLMDGRSPEQRCAIGSVKTNIGHLEAAAGIAGLIKTVLALQHRQIPPHLHLETLNPKISLEETPFWIPTALVSWAGDRRLAGVSSFGFGGTNAHVVLSEAPPTDIERKQAPTMPLAQLLPLSARSPVALQALALSYRSFLLSETARRLPLSDICYTASVRRSHHPYRLPVVGHSHTEMVEHLDAFLQDANSIEEPIDSSRQSHSLNQPPIVFVFSGQGPQWWAMGRELLEREPVFQAALQQCDALFYDCASWSLLHELTADEASSRLQETAIAQPILFALQVALAALWQSWGVVPEAVVGHSMGEVAAAYVSGALNLPDAVQVIFHRSRLLQRLAGSGRMATVDLPLAAVKPLLQDHPNLSIAAVNSPTATVLSGDVIALESLAQTLEQQNITCRFLPVNYAFHSWQVDPLQDELVHALQAIQPRPITVSLFSTVTGQRVDGQTLDASYWSRNLRSPVLFQAAMEALIQTEPSWFVEIGPHPVLRTAIAQCLQPHQRLGMMLPSLRRGQPERATLLQSLGVLYRQGYPVAWNRLYPTGQCVSLPTYPWQRQRHWFSPISESLIPVTALKTAAQPEVQCRQSLAPEATSDKPFTNKPLTQDALTQDQLWSLPVGDRLNTLESYFQQRVSRVLGMAAKLPIHEPLCNVGLDSLMVVELKHGIETDLNLSLSMTEFLHCPTVAQLASRVLAQLAPPVASVNVCWEEGAL
ncbi:type I polyketide synthase [Stenomitos frigidus]|uniref:Beta-ketoacyl synthase n=1 Tax=Stenomitos frigidus ULC18 TaxID=2107698 RepID=A0A2T1DZL8_9CYAN|nr:type I polyketide synthase [Stenomitos frigidus]PSB25824.1 beta-ketoacyl synthase [Stenomitos frigidus ULC18]